MKMMTRLQPRQRRGLPSAEPAGRIHQPNTAHFVDKRSVAVAQRKLAAAVDSSSYVATQRKRLGGLFGQAAQLQPEEDELQMKAAPDVLQQAPEEEELMQGKFETAQLAPEEEEPLQGKFDTAQLAPEEEEPLQGKFETAQLQPEEEELQRKAAPDEPNRTGLPDNLKTGIEGLSGMSMDGVRVHYNSARPAELNALAYAQGTDIHVAPGQEKHVPHEAWHVVQQAQGRVRPTMQLQEGVPVNDDAGLEHEADVMGAKASGIALQRQGTLEEEPIQGRFAAAQLRPNKFVHPHAKVHYADGWGAKYGITSDGTLKASVPDSVAGEGTISLGWFDAPESEQDPDDRRFEKECTIGYVDGMKKDETTIIHSGPRGYKHYYD